MDERLFDNALQALWKAAGDAPLSIFIDPILRDPTQHDEAFGLEVNRAIDDGFASRHVLPRIHEDFDPLRQPYVLNIKSQAGGERVIGDTVRMALSEALESESPDFTGRTVCGWIVHDPHPVMSAQALARAARLIKPDGTRHFLRLWDPRVCWHLPSRLSAPHWANIAGAMKQWLFVDPLRQLVALKLPGAARDGAAMQPSEESEAMPRCNEKAWQDLERIGPVNKVLAMSWDWGLMPTKALARQIDELLVRSIEQGFDSEQDLLVFAACGLTGHLQFDRHPRIQVALADAKNTDTPLASALEPFDADFWTQLQTDTQWVEDKSSAKTLMQKAPAP